MHRYLEAIFSHRLPLILPIVLSLAASVAFVATQPRTYQATGGMWFQSNTIAGDVNRSSQDPTPTPAAAATNVFHELIDTRTFCLKVAHRGQLADYVSDPRHAAQDPASRVSALISGIASGSSSRPSQQSLDDTMVYILQHNVTVSTSGPHIVTLQMKFTDGAVAAATLRALQDQFSDEVLASVRAQQDLAKNQLDDRQKVMQNAEAAVAAYMAAHPELRQLGAPPDAVLDQLQQTANQDRTRYSEALTQYDQMRLQGDASNFRVIDRPATPGKPVSWLSSLLLAAAAGLGIGLLLSFVGVILLVLGDSTIVSEDEIEQSLGVKSAGSVPLASGRSGSRWPWRKRPRQRPSRPGAPA
jgi:uncharacterized protein involved in exopolysaccharide biosynthesis